MKADFKDEAVSKECFEKTSLQQVKGTAPKPRRYKLQSFSTAKELKTAENLVHLELRKC